MYRKNNLAAAYAALEAAVERLAVEPTTVLSAKSEAMRDDQNPAADGVTQDWVPSRSDIGFAPGSQAPSVPRGR